VVTILIILASVTPMLVALMRRRRPVTG
jgi:hypothetical protein